jgi:hypothetical protein
MRKLALTLLVALATIASTQAQEVVINSPAQAQVDEEHTKWVDHVMRSIATIKPGMTRQDLLQVFAEEGGLSTRTRRTYVYKHCPHIKVEVDFSPVEDLSRNHAPTAENPADRIVKISRPFLEYSIMD